MENITIKNITSDLHSQKVSKHTNQFAMSKELKHKQKFYTIKEQLNV